VQAAEWSEAADGDGDGRRHAGENPTVEKDAPAADLADVDQPVRVLVLSPTPTEPEVTDVTPASTTDVLIGDDQRIRARMLGQPALGLVVDDDSEFHVSRLLSPEYPLPDPPHKGEGDQGGREESTRYARRRALVGRAGPGARS
jgi:hypothetical protein